MPAYRGPHGPAETGWRTRLSMVKTRHDKTSFFVQRRPSERKQATVFSVTEKEEK